MKMTDVDARLADLESRRISPGLSAPEENELRDCEIALGMVDASSRARADAARRVERFAAERAAKASSSVGHKSQKLVWSPGSHRGSSDVHHEAEAPGSLAHGAYRIRRGEGGAHLSYQRWRDDNGGAVALFHEMLGTYPDLSAAKAAAGDHHRDRLARRREAEAAALGRGSSGGRAAKKVKLKQEIKDAIGQGRLRRR